MAINTTDTNASKEIALINEAMTGPPADALIERSAILQETAAVDVFDNATGTGILTVRLLSKTQLHRLMAGDIDESYLTIARERGINAVYADQQDTGLSRSFNYIFNNFGIFFAKDTAVLSETLRMLQPGGFAGFTSWRKFTWWDEILVPAMGEIGAPALPSPARMFADWSLAESTMAKLQEAGFVDATAEEFSFTPDVSGEDLVKACAHLAKTVALRAWTQQEQQTYIPQIEGAMLRYLHEHYTGGRWTGKMSALLTWGWKARSI